MKLDVMGERLMEERRQSQDSPLINAPPYIFPLHKNFISMHVRLDVCLDVLLFDTLRVSPPIRLSVMHIYYVLFYI